MAYEFGAILLDLFADFEIRIKQLVSKFIHRFSLLVCDVVILEDMFSRFKVQALDLFLRVFDGSGDHLRVDAFALFDTKARHYRLDAVAAEYSKQIILKA